MVYEMVLYLNLVCNATDRSVVICLPMLMILCVTAHLSVRLPACLPTPLPIDPIDMYTVNYCHVDCWAYSETCIVGTPSPSELSDAWTARLPHHLAHATRSALPCARRRGRGGRPRADALRA